ncbi:hypothetical protein BH11PAT2_BH11PAT2_05740 [soil metagenome]
MTTKKLLPYIASSFFLLAMCAFSLTPVTAHATVGGTPSATSPTVGGTPDSGTSASGCGGALCNPLKNISSLSDLLSAVLNAVVKTIAPIILTLALIYVGFMFVMAQGNEEKIRSARSALVWTVVGGLILLGANAILLVIQSTVSGL